MDAQKDKSPKALESVVREMKIEEPEESIFSSNGLGVVTHKDEDKIPSKNHQMLSEGNKTPASVSPIKTEVSTSSSEADNEEEKVIKADVLVKQEPGQPPKLSRMASQKISTKPVSLYLDYPDKTDEATSSFQVISDCIYAAKYLGATEHAFECDCAEEWDSSNNVNHACGAESDCINRATKMECIGECGCGADCQNQRFQQKSYATVSVIQTEKKGFGLRAESNMQPHDFIFEYIGEVINELAFRRRMRQYDEEGIKHFYFMSLSKGEFIDATKKGNLGRFCNHSCNPNCYVDKWVVGDKLRMGIFASRNIKAGEELQFNYNVDRYGADPQPCYCGEPNCTGYIGGKTQTERGTKLSTLTIEALGIDDGDDWDTAIAKKPRKKKKNEDDEEYVVNVQPKALDEAGVTKVMATLRQCKEKWIAVKLLSRIQRAEEEKVRHRVVRMHGYQILNTTLSTWMEDTAVALQILDILFALPRITRNKIQDSKIEGTVEKLPDSEDEKLRSKANELLDIWSKLEIGYRIPRVKRDPNMQHSSARTDILDRRASARDRSRSRSRSRERSLDAPKGPSAPSGPRSNIPQKNPAMFGGRQPFRRPFHPLPTGWFAATSNGRTYYYSASGQTTWQRPTAPASQPPPPPPKVMTHEQKLQEIINSITQGPTPKDKTLATASEPVEKVVQKNKKYEKNDKWRNYSEEKQKKLYENTLFPHIKYVMDRYKSKLPRDDLKRFGKEVAKKLVNSDYKNKRVQDPTRISPKQEKQVKKYVKEFFDKAVAKREQHDRKKAERRAKDTTASLASLPNNEDSRSEINEEEDDVKVNLENMKMEDDIASEDEVNGLKQEMSPYDEVFKGSESPSDLKRKRDSKTPPTDQVDDIDFTTPKKIKSETDTPPPPPPPPPPPEDMQDDDLIINDKVEFVETNIPVIKQEQFEEDLSFKSSDIPLRANGVSDAEAFANKLNGETRSSLRPKFEGLDGAPSPMQLATPPINGFFELDKTGDKAKQVNGRKAVQEVTVADN